MTVTLQFFRFASVGAFATVLHIAVALALALIMSTFAANLGGFLAAFGFSYLGHQRFTFRIARQSAAHARRLPRFLATALSAMLLSQLVLLALEGVGLTQSLALVMAALVIPPYSFLLSRIWVFHESSA